MRYYDRQGNKISREEFFNLFERGEPYKRVGLWGQCSGDLTRSDDLHPGELFVSTVWLGIDHSFGRGTPEIFETMVFSGAYGENPCIRYATEKAAIAGHNVTVRNIVAGQPLWFMEG